MQKRINVQKMIKMAYKETKRSSLAIYLILRFLVIVCMILQIIRGDLNNALLCLLSLVLLSACIFTLSGCIDEGNKITKLEITNKPTEVIEGQDFQLETKYTPSDLKNVSLNWESDDDSIATVKDGVVKVSIVLCDGREFNITYLKGLDMISLLKDEINKMTTASFHARIESDTATFYRINRKLFEQYVKENEELHAYIESYYRKKMTEAIYRQQLMTMNGKNGAVCAFIYHLIPLFGRQVKKGIFIDLQITNDDIANFCGVSTRNSVNRILRGLREENVITMVYHKILILDVDYLKRYVQ